MRLVCLGVCTHRRPHFSLYLPPNARSQIWHISLSVYEKQCQGHFMSLEESAQSKIAAPWEKSISHRTPCLALALRESESPCDYLDFTSVRLGWMFLLLLTKQSIELIFHYGRPKLVHICSFKKELVFKWNCLCMYVHMYSHACVCVCNYIENGLLYSMQIFPNHKM